ncbi:glycosyltransferase family 2 protein [Cohnella thermotolerans]|uniref:glycosyltransferase family 2 protein n=1 Tax=Cohnella thermotolerans TaxID=329858 RepID=UPI0003F89B6C|nr:glycosyltransferase [Cohnella thermotolerans]
MPISDPKISIIVPAWNAEPYLRRCLDSIAAQTFSDFEAIVVDGGSTDCTAAIVQAYAREDARFHYCKHVFAPPGEQRNFGMDRARSPYIAFADSDDVLEPEMLEMMANAALSEDADIVVCDFNMVYPDRVIPSFSRLEAGNFALSDDRLAEYYYRFSAAPKPNNYVWSRLYRREFIRQSGVRFTNTMYSEDHLFNLMLHCAMPRITHVGQALYNYIQRDNSVVRQSGKRHNHGQIYYSVFDKARQYLEGTGGSFVTPILGIYAFTRIRSILFYGQLAGLPDDKLQNSVMSFLMGDKVEHYLTMCERHGYLEEYGCLHAIPDEQTRLFRQLLALCLQKEQIAVGKGWFA